MSAQGWRPFETVDAGLKWFARNCGHCWRRPDEGREHYPAPPCTVCTDARRAFVQGELVALAFFRIVFGRDLLPGDLCDGCVRDRCKSRYYTGGRGRHVD